MTLTVEDVIIGLPPLQRGVVVDLRRQVQESEARATSATQQLKVAMNRIDDLEAALVGAKAAASSTAPPPAQLTLVGTAAAMKAAHESRLEHIRREAAERVAAPEDPSFDAKSIMSKTVASVIHALPIDFELVDLDDLHEQVDNDGAPAAPLQAALVKGLAQHVDAVRQCSGDQRHMRLHRDPLLLGTLAKAYDACRKFELKLQGGTAHLTLPSRAVKFAAPSLTADRVIAPGPLQNPVVLPDTRSERSFAGSTLPAEDRVADDTVSAAGTAANGMGNIAVGVDVSQRGTGGAEAGLTDATLAAARQREFMEHMAGIDECGAVFQCATREATQITEMMDSAAALPKLASEFDELAEAVQTHTAGLVRNEQLLVEAGSAHIATITDQRRTAAEEAEQHSRAIEGHHREVDRLFAEIGRLLTTCEQEYAAAAAAAEARGQALVDVAICDKRTADIRAAAAEEVRLQQLYGEGAKLSAFLAAKAKEAFVKLLASSGEAARARREHCERNRQAAQEQLYGMAEVLHNIIVKRQAADQQAVRAAQAQLEAANRSLLGLVQRPSEMDAQMARIRLLTVAISNAKARLTQDVSDTNAIRSALGTYDTLAFLGRGTSSFISEADESARAAKVRGMLDAAVVRAKEAGELLVEVSDPDARHPDVVAQTLEALRLLTAELGDVIAHRDVVETIDEACKAATATRLRRHRRLLVHYLSEMRTDEAGDESIAASEPAIVPATSAAIEGSDSVVALLAGTLANEDAFGRKAVPVSYPSGISAATGGAFARSSSFAHPPGVLSDTAGDPSEISGAFSQDPAGTVPRAGGDGVAHHFVSQTFGRFSPKLRVSADLTRLSKPPGGIEMSNTSVVCAVGFRANSGVHRFAIRIGTKCHMLLAGLADWNLPVDGYCNSLKYPNCYFLHLGNGTLWAPGQHMERRPFTAEAVGSGEGEVLQVVVDTVQRTIGYVWRGQNLGVAFRDVNMTRTLYPAFEVFSQGCSFELCNDSADTGPR